VERKGLSARSRTAAIEAAFSPTRVLEIELSEPLQALPAGEASNGRRYGQALALVRLHTQPVGCVTLPLDDAGLGTEALAEAIWRQLGAEINAHLAGDGWPPVQALGTGGLPAGDTPCLARRRALLSAAPPASIIVATRDRPESLPRSLDSLLALEYPDYEIIVVDNAPRSAATAELIRERYGGCTRLRYLREDSRGSSAAINRGLLAARGSIAAITDDDVIVDQHWLAGLAGGFCDERVGCVTGLILPGELETPAQDWAQRCGLAKRLAPRVYDLDELRSDDPLYPFAVGTLGAGANMAFRTEALAAMGGFDPALGAGCAARGGLELAAFLSVLARGYRLVYEPAALLYHYYPRDWSFLRRQAWGYGVGLAAALTGALLANPALIPSFVARVPRGLAYALSPHSAKNAKKPAGYPRALSLVEYLGMLLGPLAYAYSRRQTRTAPRLRQRQAVLVPAVAGKEVP